jgi:pimeloyl-ACP methyl ester carboxylesterase
MKLFEHKKVHFKYRVEGESGPVYLLLHGFGGGPQDWENISRDLAKRNRVVIPNLKVFFSNEKAITFTEQVEILDQFVGALFLTKKIQSINLAGQSYGGTLSLCLRLNASFPVRSHALFNPMPFHPLLRIYHPQFRILSNLAGARGALAHFFSSSSGKGCLVEMARLFRIGSFHNHEVSHINERKLKIIYLALQRFLWIDQNEDWLKWERKLSAIPADFIHDFYYSNQDCLYNRNEYRQFGERIKSMAIHECEHKGHLLVQDLGVNLLRHWLESVK